MSSTQPLSGGNWTDLKWKPWSSLIRHCISCGHSARVGKVTWHWGRLDVLCLGYRAVAGLHMSWLCQLPWSKLYQDESTHWSSWLPQFKPLGEHLWILRPFVWNSLKDIRNSFGQAPISLAAKDALSRCRSRRGSLASFLSARELNPKPSDKCFWNEVMDRFCNEGSAVDEIIWNSAAIRSVP